MLANLLGKQRRSSLLALELFDGHCVQGGNPTDPVLAKRYDLLSDKARGRVVYDFQSQGNANALQSQRHFADRLWVESFA